VRCVNAVRTGRRDLAAKGWPQWWGSHLILQGCQLPAGGNPPSSSTYEYGYIWAVYLDGPQSLSIYLGEHRDKTMSSNRKYAALPDLVSARNSRSQKLVADKRGQDSAPDIYETPELTDDNSTVPVSIK